MLTKQASFRILALGALSIVSGSSAAAYAAADDANRPVGADPGDAATTNSNITSTTLPEIIVTAERREEPISRVPMSITAFSQAQMDQQSIQSIDDLAAMTPGLTFQRGTGLFNNDSNIAIRGILATNGIPTTGVYIDDIPLMARQNGNLNANPYPVLFDLDRVEVLKGPQGTLFGEGSEGGAVRFITPTPSLTTDSGYGREQFGVTKYGTPTYEAGLAAGGPIVEDKVGFRMSAEYRRDGGFIDRDSYSAYPTSSPNENYQETVAFRAAFLWAPIEQLKITPSVHYQQTYSNGHSEFWVQLSDPDKGKFINGDPAQSPDRDQMIIPSLNIEASVAGLNIISTTSYISREDWRPTDFTEWMNEVFAGLYFAEPDIPGEVITDTLSDQEESFTQELRVQSQIGSSLKYTVGVFYRRLQQSENYQLGPLSYINEAIEYGGGTPFTGNPSGPLYSLQYQDVDEQIAGFGQVDWEILKNLTLTAGLREAHLKFKGANVFDATSDILANTRKDFGASSSPFTPKFGVSYQATSGTLVYASAGKGYREGGGQQAYSESQEPFAACLKDFTEFGITQTPSSFGPDSTWSYELGTKNRLSGGKVSVDGAIFYTRWSNIQSTVYMPDCGYQFTDNLATASSKGVEFAGSAWVLPHLNLSANLTYVDTEIDKTVGGPGTGFLLLARRGDKFGGPPFNAVLSSLYELPIGSGTGYWRTEYIHESAGVTRGGSGNAYNDPAVLGYNPYVNPDPATNMVNMRVGYRYKTADVSLFVDNLLYSSPLLGETTDTTSPNSVLIASTFRPRTIGVTVGYRY